jgi:predicted cupin superfamily sugar epimerase
MMIGATTPDEIIATLRMRPHPEGGHYIETWRHHQPGGGRGAGTAIYYLLQSGERSHWHRVDAAEIWHWYAGAPLELSLSTDGVVVDMMVLGNDLASGARPQILVPAGVWQSAASAGPWSLVGCTVSPAFEFSGFEMAAPGWRPG